MHDEDAFIDGLKKIAMTPEETAAVEQRLQAFMSENPVMEGTGDCPMDMHDEKFIGALRGIRMTVEETERMHAALPGLGMASSPAPRAWLRVFWQPTAMLSGVLIAFLGVGGMAYAAESALPGDTLYPVKIHVNETVRERLIFSREARAHYRAERLEARLQEAEILEARGRLSGERRTVLIRTFEERKRRAQEGVRSLEARNPEAAAALRNRMERTLERRAGIVHMLEEQKGESIREPLESEKKILPPRGSQQAPRSATGARSQPRPEGSMRMENQKAPPVLRKELPIRGVRKERPAVPVQPLLRSR